MTHYMLLFQCKTIIKNKYFGILHLRALNVYFLLDQFPEFMFEYPFIYCSLQIPKWYIFSYEKFNSQQLCYFCFMGTPSLCRFRSKIVSDVSLIYNFTMAKMKKYAQHIFIVLQLYLNFEGHRQFFSTFL